jgi:hypothetical protein
MLTNVLLRFTEVSARKNYERDRNMYYAKLLPVIAFGLISLLVTIEIVYRGAKLGLLHSRTSIINAVTVIFFIALLLINRRNKIVASWLVCPGLTAFIFYYVDFVDYDGSDLSILYKMVLGITLSFFLLIFFSEQWLISTAVYIPFMVTFMWRSGKIMSGDVAHGELAARCLFCAVIYCATAIKLERLKK